MHEIENYEKIFKPVTEKLKDVISVSEIKQEPKTEPPNIKIVSVNTTPSPMKFPLKGDNVPISPNKKLVQFTPISTVTEHIPTFEEDNEREIHRRNSLDSIRNQFSSDTDSPMIRDYLEQYPEITRSYVRGFIFDQKDEYDTTYGLNFDAETNKWFMGKSHVDFDSKGNIFVDRQPFTASLGLYELLFKAKPKVELIGPEDKIKYAEILNITNAHKRNYDPNQQVKGSSSYKYLNFVKKNITPKIRGNKAGTGLLADNSIIHNEKPIEFVYYDDPNQIVERLKILIASSQAGNNSHHNEINSIIEELKESHIIA